MQLGQLFDVFLADTMCFMILCMLFFQFYSRKQNPEFLQLDDQIIQIKYGEETVYAKFRHPQEFLLGHITIVYLGFKPLDFVANYHKDKDSISVELIDGENFRASDYFDVLENR